MAARDVTIRLATAADGAAIAAIYRPAVTDATISFELTPPTADEMAARIDAVLLDAPWLVWVEGGAVRGYAYASKHRSRAAYQWSVETSAYVANDWHRRGVARGLYASLFALLRLQGVRNAYAGITLPNPASEALHAAMGFAPVGVYRGVGYKGGAWLDVAWSALVLQALEGPPAAPLTLADAKAEAGWTAAMDAGLSSAEPSAEPSR